MTDLDDTVVMSDDTDVMPACSLPVPPGELARRRPPLSGRRRATDSSPAYPPNTPKRPHMTEHEAVRMALLEAGFPTLADDIYPGSSGIAMAPHRREMTYAEAFALQKARHLAARLLNTDRERFLASPHDYALRCGTKGSG